VLNTHDMDEAATLADRVGIMDNGKLLALDTPGALTRSLPGSSTLELTIRYAEDDTAEAVASALANIPGVERIDQVAMVAEGKPAGPPPGFPLSLGGPASGAASAGLIPEGSAMTTV